MEQDFPLPALNPFLKLYQAPESAGEPAWSLHNPVTNTYFRVAWAEFECLARFSRARTAAELKQLVEKETPVRIEIEEISGLVKFLVRHGLTAMAPASTPYLEQKLPLWKLVLHRYLYFTVPLFRPENFLRKTLPAYLFLSSPFSMALVCVIAFLAVFLTARRIDEFLNSFAGMLSWEGVVLGLVVFVFTKIIHELSHAYTAVRYGVQIPHMGIAVIALYPVLYTETTGSWKLSSRRERFRIGMAGIAAEIFLAVWALLLWNFTADGSLAQSLCFGVVAVSLISSLLVNLNPLMRFDGYYMLSDMLGIENLQDRSLEFARWKIRRVLFGAVEEKPDFVPRQTEKILTAFGLCLLAYRLLLYFGIALLVYKVFMKPLGLFLFIVEIGWFIVLPIVREIKQWVTDRRTLLAGRRTKFTGLAFLTLLLLSVVPWQAGVSAPGVVHAAREMPVYAHTDSRLIRLEVGDGQAVKKEDILVEFSSARMDQDASLARQKLNALEAVLAGALANPERDGSKLAETRNALDTVKAELKSIENEKEKMLFRAPFAGRIVDFNADNRKGTIVSRRTLLFRLIEPGETIATAYIAEEDLERVRAGSSAFFIPDANPLQSRRFRIDSIAETSVRILAWPQLASIHRGPLRAEYTGKSGELVPLRSLYEVTLYPLGSPSENPDAQFVQGGQFLIEADKTSFAGSLSRSFASLIRKEMGLNGE